MTTVQQAIDQSTHWRITQFLMHESLLLDAGKIGEWVDLLTDDFRYEIPIPITPDSPSRNAWADGAFIVEESRDSLVNLWAKRHEQQYVEFAWGENPRQRTRRFIANIVVCEDDSPTSFVVRSNVLLSFARQSDPVILVPAGRIDHLRETADGFRLARRVVHLDQTIVNTTHLRLIF